MPKHQKGKKKKKGMVKDRDLVVEIERLRPEIV